MKRTRKLLASALAALLLVAMMPVTAIAGSPFAPLTIAVDALGNISGDTATQASDTGLYYALVSASKATEIAVWDTDTNKTTIESDLGETLSGKDTPPTITDADNGKFLVVVELLDSGDTLVAAGESNEIDVKVLSLTIAVDALGNISGDTATQASGTGLYYALVSASKATEIAQWDLTTVNTAIESDLGETLSAKDTPPTITDADNGKFLVVVELLDSGDTLVAVGESNEIDVKVLSLTIAVSAQGSISGDTATQGSGTTLYYALVSASKASEIAGWTLATDETAINTDLDPATLSTTKPTITTADNGKFLVVVELLDSGDTLVAVGASAAISISSAPNPGTGSDSSTSTNNTTSPASSQPSAIFGRVLARTLNQRSGPGTGFGIVGTLSLNTLIEIAGYSDDGLWALLSNGNWVSRAYLVEANVVNGAGDYIVDVKAGSHLNVRSGPGTGFATIGKLNPGDLVMVVSVENGWAMIEYQGGYAYVSAAFLR